MRQDRSFKCSVPQSWGVGISIRARSLLKPRARMHRRDVRHVVQARRREDERPLGATHARRHRLAGHRRPVSAFPPLLRCSAGPNRRFSFPGDMRVTARNSCCLQVNHVCRWSPSLHACRYFFQSVFFVRRYPFAPERASTQVVLLGSPSAMAMLVSAHSSCKPRIALPDLA